MSRLRIGIRDSRRSKRRPNPDFCGADPRSAADALVGRPGSRERPHLLVILFVCFARCAFAGGSLDPEFKKLPFDEWLAKGRQAQIRWSVEVLPARLSTHQRLIVKAVAHVDGRELDRRRGEAQFLELIQFQDSAGNLWQNHTSINLATLQPGLETKDVDFSYYAFVLPGDYTLSLAVCDPATLEHSLTVRRVHVAPLKDDPFPDAWADLPAVEFIPSSTEPPDVWYLPEIRSRLRIALDTRRPVHIDVLVNTTPSQRAAGSTVALRSNMSVLIPALKILSGVAIHNGSLDAALLDLTHRRVPFEQKNVHDPDWAGMRKIFVDAKPGIVDVRTLEGEWKMRRFFWDEVTERLNRKADGIHVVIVLSGPAFLEDQEPVAPMMESVDPDRRVFYIRYRTVAVRTRPITRQARPGGRGGVPIPPSPRAYPMPVDDLEHTVEPMGAQLFDATSAEQFRRILATVLEQISRM